MEDTDLVQLCQKGDMDAFEQLFRKYQKQVYNISFRMMGNRDDALDITQEIFVRAYQKIDKFNFKSSFSTWLYRLATNFCIDELRRHKRDVNIMPLENANLEVDQVTPEDIAIMNDREKEVWNALNSLKEKERAIIILKDIDGLSYNEIAEILECSLGRVKSRIHEARQNLKAILEKRMNYGLAREEVQ